MPNAAAQPRMVCVAKIRLNRHIYATFQKDNLRRRFCHAVGLHAAKTDFDSTRSFGTICPQRQVYGRRLSATLKDLQVGMAGSLSCWRHLHGICSRSPAGLLALMESANRGLITRAGSDVPMKRQASLGCVGSTDCAITLSAVLANGEVVGLIFKTNAAPGRQVRLDGKIGD
jgi:hypothetical protein